MKINLIFKNSDQFLLTVSINLTLRQKKVELVSVKEDVLVVLGISKGKIKTKSYHKDFMLAALEK